MIRISVGSITWWFDRIEGYDPQRFPNREGVPMETHSLSALLAPVTLDEFFGEHAFKQPLLVRGSPDKFASLFTWDSLNRILSYSRHDPLRVHLERVGATEDELEFTHHVANVRGEQLIRIDVGLLYQRLRDGATLVVDAVNEVDAAVANLSEDVAALLTAPRATTVLFASFGHVPGFSVHWDNRDVYALQVEGQKHWRVLGPSHVAPLQRGDAHVPGSGVPGPLWWEGTLQRGDMLYVPRGWWHEVTATDAPALHLNLGFSPVTAIDLLTWLRDGLRDSAFMRRDIPRFGAPEELEAYQRALKLEVSSRLAKVTVAEFLAATRAGARGQTHVSLPIGVDGQRASPAANQRVRLTSRTSSCDRRNGTCVLRAGGKEVVIPNAAAPIMDRLIGGEAVSVAELARTAPELPLDDVTSLVATLISDGVVHTVP
jgi:ribosomal protein L16 Arg81 hydroxylase